MKRFPDEMWDKDRTPGAKSPSRFERPLAPFDWQQPRIEPRGVQEVVLRADDWRGFELIGSSGSCIMYVELPASRVTEAVMESLWDKLDEMDPEGPKLGD